jgi:predicted ArsR family transcriptional regulator
MAVRSPAEAADTAVTRAAGGSFTATVSAITNAFGDPTRRGIYLYVRDRLADGSGGVDGGVTAAQVADRFGLHPNVARHHLDKLAAGGYIEVSADRALSPGAGRPSKRYRVVAEVARAELASVPVRSDDLVLSLLGKALALLPAAQAEAMAEEVGQEYGRAMAAGLLGGSDAAPSDQLVGEHRVAGQRSLRSAMQSVADALTAHGFAAHADQRNDQLRIINNHCPFGDVAIEHPVICAVDRGMVKGMLGALYGDADVSTQASRPQGDTFCATAV